jgi:hypothetical protein
MVCDVIPVQGNGDAFESPRRVLGTRWEEGLKWFLEGSGVGESQSVSDQARRARVQFHKAKVMNLPEYPLKRQSHF